MTFFHKIMLAEKNFSSNAYANFVISKCKSDKP